MAGGGLPTPHQRDLRNQRINNAPGPDPVKSVIKDVVVNPVKDVTDAVKKTADNATKPFKDLAAFFTELFSAALWERIGLILVGVALVIVGIVLLLHKAVPVSIPEVPVP